MTCAIFRTLHATTIIESRGPDALTTGPRAGYQKFVGLELKLRRPSPIQHPLLMDACMPQRDGFRFLYALPFAPDVVIPTMQHMARMVRRHAHYTPGTSFNPTWRDGEDGIGWISPWRFALNSGPVVLMIENYRSGLPWALMRRDPTIRRGLEKADFRGGWLSAPP